MNIFLRYIKTVWSFMLFFNLKVYSKTVIASIFWPSANITNFESYLHFYEVGHSQLFLHLGLNKHYLLICARWLLIYTSSYNYFVFLLLSKALLFCLSRLPFWHASLKGQASSASVHKET